MDEGVDEQVLQEMKQVWTNKLMASKAVELTIEPLEQQPPPIIANNTPKSKVRLEIYGYFLYSKRLTLKKPSRNDFFPIKILTVGLIYVFFQPNGTKSKKPSAQREHKNATNESNAQAAANVESSSATGVAATTTTATSQSAMESNAKSNQAPVANTQQQILNKSTTSQPMQTIQSNAVHQVSLFL